MHWLIVFFPPLSFGLMFYLQCKSFKYSPKINLLTLYSNFSWNIFGRISFSIRSNFFMPRGQPLKKWHSLPTLSCSVYAQSISTASPVLQVSELSSCFRLCCMFALCSHSKLRLQTTVCHRGRALHRPVIRGQASAEQSCVGVLLSMYFSLQLFVAAKEQVHIKLREIKRTNPRAEHDQWIEWTLKKNKTLNQS